MKQISNADYALTIRLLNALSKTNGQTIREKENARKAKQLIRKFQRNEERGIH